MQWGMAVAFVHKWNWVWNLTRKVNWENAELYDKNKLLTNVPEGVGMLCICSNIALLQEHKF